MTGLMCPYRILIQNKEGKNSQSIVDLKIIPILHVIAANAHIYLSIYFIQKLLFVYKNDILSKG